MAKQKEVVLSGRNIYYDKHKRAIYYNKRKGIGYVIPKEAEGKFQNLSYRYIVALIALIFCYYLFKLDIKISLLISLAVYGYMEFSYRKALSNMTQLRKFVPEESKSSAEKLLEFSSGNLILRLGLYLALSILLIVNIFVTEDAIDNTVIVVASCLISLGSLYMASRMAMALMKKNKK